MGVYGRRMGNEHLYATRSAAVRGARQAAKRALGRSFCAYEGPDYEIHPDGREVGYLGGDRFFYRLRGPALEAASAGVVKVPMTFLDDHSERDLPTPAIVRKTRAHYFISLADPELAELVDDARHYATDGCDCETGLKLAARALLAAIDKGHTHGA